MNNCTDLQLNEKEPVLQATAEELVSPENAYRPDVDIFYSPEAYLFQVDLPGIKEEDIQLEIDEKNTLILRARNQVELAGDVVFKQISIGNYYRAFSLNDEVDRNQVKAKYENGVLNIHLPKREEIKPKRVAIKVN
jgi:HSP20 family protein